METIYDWVTIALFAGLIVLFLQRSTQEVATDRVIDYLPPAVGCALANYLGNHEQHPWAIVTILAVIAYSWFILKPLAR